MNRLMRTIGCGLCLVAMVATLGGHWLALQSIAWGRMIADFSRQDSVGTAIAKTFSGKYPCPLCLKVRKGLHQEQERQDKLPWLKTEKMPEAVWQLCCVTAPRAPTAPRHDQPFVPTLHADFIDPPLPLLLASPSTCCSSGVRLWPGQLERLAHRLEMIQATPSGSTSPRRALRQPVCAAAPDPNF